MSIDSTSKFKNSSTQFVISVTNVAIAIIHHQDQYLLGYRNSEQHQGDNYEFIGGKIESGETAVSALIREVMEETGIDISDNLALKLGRLHHDYGDKQVCLQVYKVELSTEQHKLHAQQNYGLEDQALTWVAKQSLLNNDYPLPAANKTILAWLKLPEMITITYPLAHFELEQAFEEEAQDKVEKAWLQYHQQQLFNIGWSYLRLKLAESEDRQSVVKEADIIQHLIMARSDINSIVPYQLCHDMQSLGDELSIKPSKLQPLLEEANVELKIAAYHLTQTELITWFNRYQNQQNNVISRDSIINTRVNNSVHNLLNTDTQTISGLVISCHDTQSIIAANLLAKLRLTHCLAPVIAIFLSPVLATKTHLDSAPLGWEQWSALAELADMPVIALGGLSPEMISIAKSYGASSVAGIRGFLTN